MDQKDKYFHEKVLPIPFESVKRIAIIGNAGGGKTTLAALIGKKTGYPVFSLDAIQWKPGWVKTDENEFHQKHSQLLINDAWIIEGWGYAESLNDRLHASEMIIFIDLSLFAHYRWAIKRQIKNIFIPREELPGKYPLGMNTVYMLIAIMRFHMTVRPMLQQLIPSVQNNKKLIHITSPDLLQQTMQQLHFTSKTQS
jgi:adenylate kinase family enzyme